MRAYAARANGQQPGNPERLARVLIRLAEHPSPPQRLALGSDALRRVADKVMHVQQELEKWKTWSLYTDYSSPEETLE